MFSVCLFVCPQWEREEVPPHPVPSPVIGPVCGDGVLPGPVTDPVPSPPHGPVLRREYPQVQV